MSGSGFAFLALYRDTLDQKWLYRAHCFAEFLFTEDGRASWSNPDRPFSLFEGLAGAACFLIDLREMNHSSI